MKIHNNAKSFLQMWHGKRALIEEMKRVNGYDLLMNLNEKEVMSYQKKELLWFQKDMDRFIFNSFIEGLKISIGRFLLRFPLIQAWRDKKKYPIKKENND